MYLNLLISLSVDVLTLYSGEVTPLARYFKSHGFILLFYFQVNSRVHCPKEK